MDAKNNYKYVDILRGIAVLGVLAVHSGHQFDDLNQTVANVFNFGQMGVQLFFVVSAVTLSFSMIRRSELNVVGFYIRRFFRIAPLYYFAIVFYFFSRCIGGFFLNGVWRIPEEYRFFGVLQNIFFMHGFFPNNFNWVVPGGWSISVEVVFYIIFPYIFKLIYNMNFCSAAKFVFFTVISLLIFQIMMVRVVEPYLFAWGYIGGVHFNNDFGYIYASILNQIPVFMIGILTFKGINYRIFGSLWFFVAFFLLILSFGLLNFQDWKFGYNGFFYPIAAAISYGILIVYFSSVGNARGWIFNMLAKIGRVSFSVYIFHFFIIDIMVYFVANVFCLELKGELLLLTFYISLIFASYVISIFSFKYIESRGIDWGRQLAEKYTL